MEAWLLGLLDNGNSSSSADLELLLSNSSLDLANLTYLINSNTIYGIRPPRSGVVLFGAPPLLLLGTVGNILSLIVMKKFASRVTTYLYLAALACMNLLVLYVGLIPRWLFHLTDLDILSMSPILCKVGNFLGYVTSHVAVWLIVGVACERVIIVNHPKLAAKIRNVKNAKFIILGVVVCFCLLNSHFFWTVGLHDNGLGRKCQTSKIFSQVIPWVDGFIYFAAPFTITSVFVSCMLYHLVKRPNHQRMFPQAGNRFVVSDQRKLVTKKKKRLTLMLLSVSVTYLLTTLPMVVLLIIYTFTPLATNEEYQKTQLARDIVELIMYTNHAIHFFLYFRIGKEFRKYFLYLITCGRRGHCPRYDQRTRTFTAGKYEEMSLSRSTTNSVVECNLQVHLDEFLFQS